MIHEDDMCEYLDLIDVLSSNHACVWRLQCRAGQELGVNAIIS